MALERRIVLEGTPLRSPDPKPAEPAPKPAKPKPDQRAPLGRADSKKRSFFEGSRFLFGGMPDWGMPGAEPPRPNTNALSVDIPVVLPEASMRDFFRDAGMNISKDFVRCKGCNDIANFDADFNQRSIKCCTCNRVRTFQEFEEEQQ